MNYGKWIDRDISNRKIILHISLFVITFISCSFAGATYSLENLIQLISDVGLYSFSVFINAVLIEIFKIFISGFAFSIPLLIILLSHELGHYLMAKKYDMKCSLPYFIPVPLPISLIGTMGAFIKMKSPFYSRNALFDVGVTGPLVGFFFATLFLLIGIPLSQVLPVVEANQSFTIQLGESLLLKFFIYLFYPSIPQGNELMLHSTAFAGWVGYLVTALNLMPIGQLDGGHISYAVLEKNAIWVSRIFYLVLIIMAFYFRGWIIWIILMLFLGIKHPPILTFYHNIDDRRKIIAVFCLIVFILIFMPQPIKIDF